MEGTRSIALLEPRPTGERDAYGEAVQGEPRIHRTLAIREDKGGPEGEIAAGVQGGDWRTEFRIREESVSVRPTEAWSVVDDAGVHYDIDAVVEATSRARARWLRLVCERHTA